jgi:MarR family transcriptional regulator, organic hydroperoxide resistance regulator
LQGLSTRIAGIFLATGSLTYNREVPGACESDPLALLVALADRLQAAFEHAATEVGLTKGQAQLLVQIERPVRISDLAQRQACDPSTITSMIQRLERDGLVTRSVDPIDGRARLVATTAKGRRLRTRFLTTVGDGSHIIDTLPLEDRAALAGLFCPKSA